MSSKVLLKSCGCVLALLALTTLVSAQSQSGPIVSYPVQFDISKPVSQFSAVTAESEGEFEWTRPLLGVPNPGATTPQGLDTALQLTPGKALSATAGANFPGVGVGLGVYTDCCAPPDTNMAVGPNHIVQWVNLDYAIFDKSGNLLHGPASGTSFWSGFGGPCETSNGGDPIAQYDRLADRWVMANLANTGGPIYYQCIAVSTTSDPTGPYARYAYSFNSLNDYPKLGVWADAYYMSFNMFQFGAFFQGAQACAYDRNAMIAGNPSATSVCFQQGSGVGGLLPSDLDGATPPPAGAANTYMNFGTNNINLWNFHVDFATPSNSTFTGPTTLSVSSFAELCGGGTCIAQPGTPQLLDSLADRLMYRLAYRNFGGFESLVANHSVTAGSGGGVRWYEVRSPRSSPFVFQQGTYSPDNDFRWMGSIAMDQAGNMGLGYTRSSSSTRPSIMYTGRESGDALGTMQTEATMVAGTGSQQPSLSRWGDYSAIRIDPADDCTFWYTSEYLQADGTFNWSTQIGSFRFASCAPPTPPADPSNLIATAVSAVEIDLTWQDNANNESGFSIERCTGTTTFCDANTSNYTQIASVGANVTSYHNTGLTPNTTYSYRVRAFNAGGNSNYSNSAQATTPNLAPPAAPSNLVVSAGATTGKNKTDFMTLSWTDNSNNESSFIVERCTGTGSACASGSFSQIATVGANMTTYKDNGVANRTNFTYRVKARNAGGDSAYSNTASAKSK